MLNYELLRSYKVNTLYENELVYLEKMESSTNFNGWMSLGWGYSMHKGDITFRWQDQIEKCPFPFMDG